MAKVYGFCGLYSQLKHFGIGDGTFSSNQLPLSNRRGSIVNVSQRRSKTAYMGGSDIWTSFEYVALSIL